MTDHHTHTIDDGGYCDECGTDSSLADRVLAAIEEAERAAVVSCSDVHPQYDIYHPEGHPDEAILRYCAADRELVEEYAATVAKRDRAILGGSLRDECDIEVRVMERVLRNRAKAYGIKGGRDGRVQTSPG